MTFLSQEQRDSLLIRRTLALFYKDLLEEMGGMECLGLPEQATSPILKQRNSRMTLHNNSNSFLLTLYKTTLNNNINLLLLLEQLVDHLAILPTAVWTFIKVIQEQPLDTTGCMLSSMESSTQGRSIVIWRHGIVESREDG